MKKKVKDGGLEKMVKSGYEQYVVIPDLHAPYHDEESVQTAINFVKYQKPDHVVFIGDVVDLYSVSSFDKNPKRANKLQDEYDCANEILTEFRKAAPKAKMTYIEGNHEVRMKRYLWRHPELHGLRCLRLPQLLGLKELDIAYKQELFWRNTFLFTHGKRFGMYASRWELADNGVSGMSGHNHRLSVFSKTDKTGVKAWYHIGHLTDVEAAGEYRKDPDWQQGLGVVYFHNRKNRFFAEAIPVVDNKFIYHGVLYTPEGYERLGRK